MMPSTAARIVEPARYQHANTRVRRDAEVAQQVGEAVRLPVQLCVVESFPIGHGGDPPRLARCLGFKIAASDWLTGCWTSGPLLKLKDVRAFGAIEQ